MEFHGLCGNFDGLCCYDGRSVLKLFEPTGGDIELLEEEGCNTDYWGSGLNAGNGNDEVLYSFTTLRQTICLFAAAVNGEL